MLRSGFRTPRKFRQQKQIEVLVKFLREITSKISINVTDVEKVIEKQWKAHKYSFFPLYHTYFLLL